LALLLPVRDPTVDNRRLLSMILAPSLLVVYLHHCSNTDCLPHVEEHRSQVRADTRRALTQVLAEAILCSRRSQEWARPLVEVGRRRLEDDSNTTLQEEVHAVLFLPAGLCAFC
jgi:hypothetical protein